ncbi:yohH [Shigella boydii 5216-82]|nr:yohH [Shigella boydii 5216-82]EIQ33610.1 multidrug resistance outer membrane MdtQ domain protein [Shigella boydii 965-58]
MNRDSFYPAIACFPLLLMLAGCAPMHETRQALSQQTPLHKLTPHYPRR